MPANDEIKAADIARLAGVGRAAVSNWRRRHADFPDPVGGPPTSPTFPLPEVEAWLRDNGKLVDPGGDATLARGSTPTRLTGGTHEDLADVVAGLLPPLRRGVVLDPACGPGQMLVAAAQRLGSSVRLVGQDAYPTNVGVATRALASVGRRDAEIAVGSPFEADALARYRGAADLVICQAPGRSRQLEESSLELPWEFGPPHAVDPNLAWLQACYSYARPGGHAIMPMPYAASVRSSGRRIRSDLLRAGVLDQVVAMPERFARRTAGPWQIWMLRRPVDRPNYTVRLVDLTDVEHDEIPTNAEEWRAVYDDDTLTREVPSIELLDEDVLLVPARHIEPPARDVSGEYARLRAGLAKSVRTLDAKLPAFRRNNEPVTFPLTTVMDLLRAGAIAFVDRGGELKVGDVVVPSGPNRFDAAVVAKPMVADPDRAAAEVIRCDQDLLDPYFLACFLRSEANRRTAGGTLGGTLRLDLRRARIPRVPLAEQRRYGDAFRRLIAVTDEIDGVAAKATGAVRTAVYGLTSGAFVPDEIGT